MKNLVLLGSSSMLLLSFFFFSCLNGAKTKTSPNGQISGLVTFTNTGITFLECSTGDRYRVLDTYHFLIQAMGERPLRVNEPLFAIFEGSIDEHSGNLEFERRFRKRIEIEQVHLLDDEIPSVCDQHLKPNLVFKNTDVPISVVFNYYVPSAILSKPEFGRLIYFSFENEDFPDLEESEIRFSFAAQGTEAEVIISKENCSISSNDSEIPSTHSMILNFEGKEFHLCLEPEKVQ
jgi:hypothetical protein